MAFNALLAAVLLVAAVSVAAVLRRREAEPPSRGSYEIPRQLDRADFPTPGARWLVVLFSSATCDSCHAMRAKVDVLASGDVAVCELEHPRDRARHERYGIEAVPMTVVADRDGIVRAGWVGPVSATDLWAAVAELRQPGTSPEAGLGALP